MKTMLYRTLTILFLLSIITVINTSVFSQEVPQPVNNYGIYEFLDELANIQIIAINSAVKPYSRLFIALRLQEADEKRDQLNLRQQKELAFYLKDFGKEINAGKDWYRRKDLFYYKDDLFSLTVNPILGGEVFNNSSGKATYWRNGIEARGYVQNWGFFASLRDNHEKPLLGLPEYLTPREGGHLKGSTDWSEMQGGVTWSWKWGSAGIVKDRLQWGTNYNGANIFGGNNPSFVQFKLYLSPVQWFSFNYFHGWLTSMVVDSTRSYWVKNSYGTDYREVYHKKFIAANMFTFTPLKNLNISAGNSIVYTDIGFYPGYLIPLFFYKSVDHTVNDGIDNMNSQMFFDISSTLVKNLHLYGTMFIDELSVNRFFKDDEWNFFSYKAGFRLSNLPVANLSVTTEFTYSYPLVFQHYVPTLTFETNNYNLGHYLRDNAREWYLALDYKPLRTLNINFSFTDAIRGPDYTALGTDRVGNPPLETVEWHNTEYRLKATYQVINDLYTWLIFTHSNITGNQNWSPDFFYGLKNTVNFGVTCGF
jgi:hypothetical protein